MSTFFNQPMFDNGPWFDCAPCECEMCVGRRKHVDDPNFKNFLEDFEKKNKDCCPTCKGDHDYKFYNVQQIFEHLKNEEPSLLEWFKNFIKPHSISCKEFYLNFGSNTGKIYKIIQLYRNKDDEVYFLGMNMHCVIKRYCDLMQNMN